MYTEFIKYVLVYQPLCLFLIHQVSVDDVNRLYDEIVNEYSLVGPVKDGVSSVIYSTVQHCDPAPHDENALYSLITQH